MPGWARPVAPPLRRGASGGEACRVHCRRNARCGWPVVEAVNTGTSAIALVTVAAGPAHGRAPSTSQGSGRRARAVQNWGAGLNHSYRAPRSAKPRAA